MRPVRSLGFRVFRVRYIANDQTDKPNAKLQIAQGEMERLAVLESKISEGLRVVGFGEITIDPYGYRPPAAVR
jgi:PP-loop superfamily ATP-utilizing enzyme